MDDAPEHTPLHFAVATFGSRGQFVPALWAACQMKAAGHNVTMLCNPSYAKEVEEHGLRMVPVGEAELIENFNQDKGLTQQMSAFFSTVRTVNQSLYQFDEAIAKKCGKVDAVISVPLALGASTSAERLGVPNIIIHPSGYTFWMCRDIPVFGPGMAWLKKVTQKAPKPILETGFWVGRKLLNIPTLYLINRFRKAIGMKPAKDFYKDIWTRTSPKAAQNTAHAGLFPEWFDAKKNDWAAGFQNFNFPIEDMSRGELTPQTREFLQQGERPVVWTISADPDAPMYADKAIAASRELGRRAIIIAPSLDRKSEDPNVLYLKYAPYPKLLQHCDAFVNHGGVGTMAHGLATGVPQLIIPRIDDQHNNAHIASKKLGVAEVANAGTIKKKGYVAALKSLLGNTKAKERSAYWQKVMADYKAPVDFAKWAEQKARTHNGPDVV